jgi:hypothetical protein
MDIDQSVEILRLRTTVRDLLALSIIQEAWVGREPPAIAADLADLLVGSLEVDFAFVRLSDPTGGQVFEVTRGNSWKTFPQWLQQHLAEFGQISRTEIVTKTDGVGESRCGIVSRRSQGVEIPADRGNKSTTYQNTQRSSRKSEEIPLFVLSGISSLSKRRPFR